jgi:hypothetical protein
MLLEGKKGEWQLYVYHIGQRKAEHILGILRSKSTSCLSAVAVRQYIEKARCTKLQCEIGRDTSAESCSSV